VGVCVGWGEVMVGGVVGSRVVLARSRVVRGGGFAHPPKENLLNVMLDGKKNKGLRVRKVVLSNCSRVLK